MKWKSFERSGRVGSFGSARTGSQVREGTPVSRQRAQRMREGLKREISEILRTMKDPRVGFVSITDVEVSRDLRHVKAFVSIFGDDKEKNDTLTALVHAQGFVRTELGKRIRLRHTPEIVFRLDESIARGARINELLRTVSIEKDVAPTGSSGGAEDDRAVSAAEGDPDEA